MREAQASAPGKVNMLLRVGAPEKDGYHPLISVFEALDLRAAPGAKRPVGVNRGRREDPR